MTAIAAATRRMLIPVGETAATRVAASGPTRSSDAHAGISVLVVLRPRFKRSTAVSVMLVD